MGLWALIGRCPRQRGKRSRKRARGFTYGTVLVLVVSTMRSLLAGFVAVLLPACLIGTGDIAGDESGDRSGEDGTGDGNGDGNSGGTGNGGGTINTPRVQASIDKTAVSTELGKTETLMVTVQSMNGFAGNVTISPSVLDGTTALTGYSLTPTPASVTLEPGSSQQVEIKVKIPTDTAVLSPSLKIDLGNGVTTTSVFTIAKQLTVNITANHLGLPLPNAPMRIRAGTKIVFRNTDTIQHVIHGNGGITHENTGLGMPGTDYTVTPSDDATWYCHSHEGNGVARPVRIVQ